MGFSLFVLFFLAVPRIPNVASFYMFFISWLFSALVLVIVYCSNLTSYMTLNAETKTIDTIEELSIAVSKKQVMPLVDGTAYYKHALEVDMKFIIYLHIFGHYSISFVRHPCQVKVES